MLIGVLVLTSKESAIEGIITHDGTASDVATDEEALLAEAEPPSAIVSGPAESVS